MPLGIAQIPQSAGSGLLRRGLTERGGRSRKFARLVSRGAVAEQHVG
jgi:hypothetical protein